MSRCGMLPAIRRTRDLGKGDRVQARARRIPEAMPASNIMVRFLLVCGCVVGERQSLGNSLNQ
ncbi:MAG TPA: hypothetical protein V6C85_09445 [Allocoleopsis sp.]